MKRKKLKRLRNSFLFAVLKRWVRSEASLRASGLAFTSLLALVPLFALSIATFKYMGGFDKLLLRVEPYIMQYLVFGTHSFLMDKISLAVEKLHAEALGSFALFFAAITCAKLFLQFDRTLQEIWNEKRQYPFWKLLFFFLFLILGPLAFALLAGVLSNALVATQLSSFEKWGEHWFFQKGLEYYFLLLPLLVVTKWAPHKKISWINAIACSGLTLINLVLAKRLYMYATSTLIDYSKVYGSMAVVPLFLIWVVILWQIVLFGFTVSAELHVRAASEASVEDN